MSPQAHERAPPRIAVVLVELPGTFFNAISPANGASLAMTHENLNRREFTGRFAAGIAIPLVAAAATDNAAEAVQKTSDAKPPSPVERMLDLIREQYPDPRLDEAAIAEIREELESQVARSKRLSAFPLSNADEPGILFRAYRGEGKKLEDRR